MFGQLADDKGADATAVEFRDIAVSVVLLGADGEEEGRLGENKGTAVGQQPVYEGVDGARAMSTEEGGDGFDGRSQGRGMDEGS